MQFGISKVLGHIRQVTRLLMLLLELSTSGLCQMLLDLSPGKLKAKMMILTRRTLHQFHQVDLSLTSPKNHREAGSKKKNLWPKRKGKLIQKSGDEIIFHSFYILYIMSHLAFA